MGLILKSFPEQFQLRFQVAIGLPQSGPLFGKGAFQEGHIPLGKLALLPVLASQVRCFVLGRQDLITNARLSDGGNDLARLDPVSRIKKKWLECYPTPWLKQ